MNISLCLLGRLLVTETLHALCSNTKIVKEAHSKGNQLILSLDHFTFKCFKFYALMWVKTSTQMMLVKVVNVIGFIALFNITKPAAQSLQNLSFFFIK